MNNHASETIYALGIIFFVGGFKFSNIKAMGFGSGLLLSNFLFGLLNK